MPKIPFYIPELRLTVYADSKASIEDVRKKYLHTKPEATTREDTHRPTHTVDLNRADYMREYYRRNKVTLLPKAIKRYRDNVTAKYK